MDPESVNCQICHTPMRPRPDNMDPGPADWRPADDRLASILSSVYQCGRCGRVGIPPGLLRERLRPHAA